MEEGRRPQKGACPLGTVDTGPSASWPDEPRAHRPGWAWSRDMTLQRREPQRTRDGGAHGGAPQKDAHGNWPQAHPRVPHHSSQLPRQSGRGRECTLGAGRGLGRPAGQGPQATPSRGCPWPGAPAPARRRPRPGAPAPARSRNDAAVQAQPTLPRPQLPGPATPTGQMCTASPCTTTDGTSHRQEPATRANSFKQGFLEIKLKRAAGRARAHLPSAGQ